MSCVVPHGEEPPSAAVDQVVELIRRGRPVSALALLPDLEKRAPYWHDARALTTAARLAERLEGGQKSRLWHRLNFKRHPDDDYCYLYRISELGSTLGLPRALRMLEARLKKPEMLPKHRADLLSVAAGFLGGMRDFERATRVMDESRALRPDAPWLMICQAGLLRAQDRREEALALCGEALKLQPDYGQGMHLASGLLLEMNRDAEAEQILQQGCRTTEIPDLRWGLYNFYSERDRPDEALHWLNEFECRALMLSEKARRYLRGNRATLHLLRGDLAAAREEAAASGNPFFEKMAAGLTRENAAGGVRTRLPVGFVRQHHMTCAPATLAALAAYWGRPAPHLEIAEKICYDGTSSYSERTWAQAQGLDGREFCVTPEVTRALVARGVPFTLVTAWATSAHLQAVIGTDDRAGLLIIRDPTFPHYSEAHLEDFLKDYAAHGPRGMLVLPEDQRARTDGIALPEAELYDMVHAVEVALQGHDRALAQQWFDQLCARAPGHRLTWQAQLSLAGYDDNPVKAHEAHNALAALYPEDAGVAWRTFRSNRARRTRGEILTELDRRTRDPKGDFVFHSELARMLADDDRTARRSTHLLHRLLRRNPADAQALTTLANCRWADRAFDDALELFRLAACAADKNEICATGYFSACRRLNRAEEGLTFLRRRVAAFGHLAAAPHVTLAEALHDLLRTAEAVQMIEAARRLRPEDGELLTHEARFHIFRGQFEEAEKVLALAQTRVPPREWHRQMANLERLRGRMTQSVAHWQSVLAAEPMALDAHENLARLVAEQESPEQTLQLLGNTVTQWPWHMGLARLYVDWLRRAGRLGAEGELRRILAHNPADDWAWRELALELARRQRHDEAVAAAAESLRLVPSFASAHAILATVLLSAGRRAEAYAASRRALTLDVNCGAMTQMMEAAANVEERRQAIAFMRGELTRQTAGGEAVAQFRTVALGLLSPNEMTEVLREGHRTRPDIFETWFTLGEHLLAQQDPAALELMREMTTLFPWTPGSWTLYSQACAQAGKKEERRSALQHAVDIAPQWSAAARDLADLHEREGRMEEAFQEMQRVVRANPLDGANHGSLADMLLRQGRTDEGLAALERSVEVDSSYSWGWGELARQCRRLGMPERALDAAQKLTARRPDEARSWIILVETRGRLEQWTEALTETERALEQWPKNLRLNELRAVIFNATGRRQEALEACAPAAFGDAIPRELRARRASLLLEAADYSEAEHLLEELVAAEPDYAWPRSLLYDIHRARGGNARCLKLSRDLVRIEPENPVAAGMLAESLINAGRSAEAMGAVRRALALDPRYAYAAGRLFDDVLERRDFAAAQELAGLIERFQPGPASFLADGRLALAQDRSEDALRPALLLIQSDEAEAEWALQRLRDSWLKTRSASQSRLDNLIAAAVRDGRAKNRGVSGALAVMHNSPSVSQDVRNATVLPVPQPVRDAIVRDILYKASDEKLHDAVLRAVKEHRELLRSTTMLWGAAGVVLLQADRHRAVVEWCQDWKERPDRESWMMGNLGVALAWDRGPLGAQEVWEDILDAGASNVWPQAAAGLAFNSAVKGRSEEARRHLENLEGQELSSEDKFSVGLARAALAAAEAGPGSRPDNRRRAPALLKEASGSWPGGRDSALGRHYRRELEQFISRHGYDPAFAKVPRSQTPRSPAGGGARPSGGGVPSWVYWMIIAAVLIVIRIMNHTASRKALPSSPPRAPVYKPQSDSSKDLTPEQRERINEMHRKLEEQERKSLPDGKRPVHLPPAEPRNTPQLPE